MEEQGHWGFIEVWFLIKDILLSQKVSGSLQANCVPVSLVLFGLLFTCGVRVSCSNYPISYPKSISSL